MRKILFAMTMAALLSACSTTKMADPAREAETKDFKSKPDAAVVYIYRNERIGAGVGMDVSIDGKHVGKTVAKSYIYAEVPPGKHSVKGEAENDSNLDLDAKLGKVYYIWQEVKMGILYARNKLQLVGEEEGKNGVMESHLIVPEK